MIALACRIGVLAVLETIVASVAWWLNDTRRGQGPVLLPLTHGHGVHRTDLVIVGAGLLAALLVLAWPNPIDPASAHPPNAPTGRYPPIGTPRARRLGQDQ